MGAQDKERKEAGIKTLCLTVGFFSSYLIYHAISKGVSNNLSRAMCVDRVCVDVLDSTSVRSVSSALLLYPLRQFLASHL